MADWEQPSTSFNRRSGGDGPGEQIALLQQQLAAALERITALEARVSDLEARAGNTRALGA